MMKWQRVPEHLQSHYKILDGYVKDGNLKDAKTYLYNLPIDVYDEIIYRTARGYSFETLVNKIEQDTVNRKTNELFKLNNQEGDSNHLF